MKEELTQQSITAGLDTSLIGSRVYYYPQVSSTMEIAREKVLQGTTEGTIIITDKQVAGRGRLGRTWQSPPGCIALSVILYPQIEKMPYLIMLASLAVVNTIAAVTGLKAGIKWPNDILIDGRKVCGIVVESEIRDKEVVYAVIGIGINVNLEAGCLGKVALPATSLANELGRQVSRLELTKNILIEIDRLYLLVKRNDKAVFMQWQNKLETMGRQVEVSAADKFYRGVAEGVTEDGRLCLRLADGSLKKITAGDVTLQNRT